MTSVWIPIMRSGRPWGSRLITLPRSWIHTQRPSLWRNLYSIGDPEAGSEPEAPAATRPKAASTRA